MANYQVSGGVRLVATVTVAGRGASSDDEPVKVEPPRTYRVPWADLVKKVFALDILACPECSRRLKLIAFIASEAVARRILDHLGLHATGPPLARARVKACSRLPRTSCWAAVSSVPPESSRTVPATARSAATAMVTVRSSRELPR